MNRLRLLSWLVIIVSLVGSCRGCRQEEGPVSILDLAAPDAMVAAYVPDTGLFIQGLAGFITHATKNAGNAAVVRVRDSFKQQFGFDGFDPRAYAALGISGKGGALMFNEGAVKEPLLALAVADPTVFEAKLKELIEKTDGSNRFSDSTVEGFRLVTAGRPFGDEVVPAFHWAWVGRFVIIARDAGRPGLDLTLKRLRSAQTPAPGAVAPVATLKTDPLYLKLSRKLPDSTLTVFVRGNVASELGGGGPSPVVGAVTGVAVDERGLAVDTFVELPVQGLDTALKAEPVLSLSDCVGTGAALFALSRAARPEGIAALRHHPMVSDWLARAFKPLAEATSIDPERELLPLLTGPLTVSVHLGDLSELPARLKARRDVSALLDFVDVAVTAEVGDPKAFLLVLERSRTKLNERRVKIRERTATIEGETATIFEPDVAAPRLGWAVMGKRYAYGVGTHRLETTLKLLVAGKSDLKESLVGTVGETLASEPGTSVLVVRLGVLAKAATAMPLVSDKAQAMGFEVLLGAALDLLREIGDVAAGVSAEPDGLRLRLRERLQ